MARPRNPKRDEAFQIWMKSNGKKKLKEIAAELDLSDSQIRKWKNQDKWDEQLNGNVTKSKGNVSKRKRGAPVGNKNASGHGPPKGNSNALKHGLFSKYIPEDTLEIMGMLEEKSPADLIYDQIMIQYAAIIRAQKIMYVRDKYDLSKELKKENESEFGSTYEYEIKFALDKQATFLNAQSRAISELRSLIKQFNELAHDEDERRLKLEQMKLNIDKTKAEIKEISNETDSNDHTIIVNDVDEMRAVMNERNKDN
ncbi:phage terminase small subunit [Heyndrickxia ginsengihumi]|uniref:phage terminase small subunit n=1 Tax=Heyndrickxia ginsengihumi TaxID=363870 RepID=UPI003D1E206D